MRSPGGRPCLFSTKAPSLRAIAGRSAPRKAWPAGFFLIALAALALWLTRDLDQGTLNAMGPAMLPRWLAIGVGLSGLALLAFAFIKEGDALERWSLRGPGLRHRRHPGLRADHPPLLLRRRLATPGLGLLVAGPLAIILGGYATPEARLRDLVILALSLTPFCMVLFGDLLNLPIPVFPQALTEPLPRRLVAEGGAAGHRRHHGRRGRHSCFSPPAAAVRPRIDVADHSGRI